MLGRIRNAVRTLAWASPLLLLAACQVTIQKTPDGMDADGDLPVREARPPREQSLMGMARDLDHLERHIERFGSVTAKTPDVWGQARLTLYREQFEQQMAAELTTFNAGIQGTVARSDQAFFSSTLALAAAAQPKPPFIGTVNSPALALTSATRDTVLVKDTTTKTDGGTTSEKATTTTKEATPVTPAPPTLADLSKEVTDLKTAIKASETKLLSVASKQLDPGGAGIGIEPTLYLAQKKRYLDFLNQLRRENEGDDTADSPGYSLNLIRVPVSVLPGGRTDVGHGAEVTMTLTPILGDELLPATFRNFVINDLVDQLGFPLTTFLEGENRAGAADQYLTEDVQLFLQYLEARHQAQGTTSPTVLEQVSWQAPAPPPGVAQPNAANQASKKRQMTADGSAKFGVELAKLPTAPAANDSAFTPAQQTAKQQVRAKFDKAVRLPRLSYASGLNQRQAFPTSQLFDVIGIRFSFEVAYGAQRAFSDDIQKVKYAHLPNVQGYLREELQAAYQFLARPENRHLWGNYCTDEVVSLVRSQQWDKLLAKRQQYRDEVMALTGSKPLTLKPVKDEKGIHLTDETGKPAYEPNDPAETRQVSRTSALAWCILVDAALLTDRLIKDMKQTATAKGNPAAPCEVWRDYAHPDPTGEARAAFNEYVALRWPIRVFALDPATQDQNVADSFSSRREMQLALAIAFTNGLINANSMSKYARRLEMDAQTIALNRPQVGFGHGENVFGWRFAPRFQTPDTRSNLEVFLRDQVVGGPTRTQLLRERRLEPGMRECVAVVMMPAFVPYVRLDATSNWYALADPKRKLLDHTQALRLSRTVQTIKTEACGVRDADRYREGEFDRLLKRADQLDARLPTQTVTAAVPVLNTLGGFEMFSNGATDLAPELYGWYGAPGIDPDADATTLFLVGDHFSPLRTRVVVGNQEVDPVASQRMLSRQVMQVKVARGSYAVNGAEVRVHLATPYGVTRELSVPVVSKVKKAEATKPAPPAPEAGEGYELKTTAAEVRYWLTPDGKGKYRLLPKADPVDPPALRIAFPDATGSAPEKLNVTFVFTYAGTQKMLPFQAAAATYNPARGEYTVPLRQLAEGMLAVANTRGAVDAPGTAALDDLKKTVAVVISPVDAGRAVTPVPAKNQIEFKFAGEIEVAPVAPIPKAKPDDAKPKADEPKAQVTEPKGPDAPLPPVPTLPPLPLPIPMQK